MPILCSYYTFVNELVNRAMRYPMKEGVLILHSELVTEKDLGIVPPEKGFQFLAGGDYILVWLVPDIHMAYSTLKQSGIEFDSAPHLIYRDGDGTFGPAGGEEWMAFFKDPDGNVLALASRISAPAA